MTRPEAISAPSPHPIAFATHPAPPSPVYTEEEHVSIVMSSVHEGESALQLRGFGRALC